jgi:hypothetical protein
VGEKWRCHFSEWALKELKFASFTVPFCILQRLQLDIHIITRGQTFTGHHNHHLLQHPSLLRDELEESNLAFRTLELIEKHLLHGLQDTFNWTAILPELEIDLATGLFGYLGLQIKLMNTYSLGSYEDRPCSSKQAVSVTINLIHSFRLN